MSIKKTTATQSLCRVGRSRRRGRGVSPPTIATAELPSTGRADNRQLITFGQGNQLPVPRDTRSKRTDVKCGTRQGAIYERFFTVVFDAASRTPLLDWPAYSRCRQDAGGTRHVSSLDDQFANEQTEVRIRFVTWSRSIVNDTLSAPSPGLISIVSLASCFPNGRLFNPADGIPGESVSLGSLSSRLNAVSGIRLPNAAR